MALVNNLDDLERALKLCKESGVKLFKSGDLTVVLDESVQFETDAEEAELDEKTPGNPMGFDTTDVRGLQVMTEFDEE